MSNQSYPSSTADYMVAQYYAAYAKQRSNAESVVIVTVSIPNRQIKSLREPDILKVFWPDPEWKQLVWSCRNGQRMPKNLGKYQEAALITGTIARKPNSSFEVLASPEAVTEDYVLEVEASNGRHVPATQFVFGEEGEDLLTAHAEIKIFPFVRAEIDTWIEENRRVLP